MSTATLTSKGQINIPVSVRNDLKVDAGDRVEFVQIAPGRYEFVAVTHSVTELKGLFGMPAKNVSIGDMNKAIAQRGAAFFWWGRRFELIFDLNSAKPPTL